MKLFTEAKLLFHNLWIPPLPPAFPALPELIPTRPGVLPTQSLNHSAPRAPEHGSITRTRDPQSLTLCFPQGGSGLGVTRSSELPMWPWDTQAPEAWHHADPRRSRPTGTKPLTPRPRAFQRVRQEQLPELRMPQNHSKGCNQQLEKNAIG